MSPDKALYLLGINGLSDSVKVATQGFVDGAAAFLSRMCLPAAEEFGLALRDRVSAWRARNAIRMLSKANTVYLANDPTPEDRLSPWRPLSACGAGLDGARAAAGRGGYRKSHLEAALLHEDPLVAVGVHG